MKNRCQNVFTRNDIRKPGINLLAIKKIMMDEIVIRSAKTSDDKLLTDISFKSKNYWYYPNSFYEIWNNELTITQDYIKQNIVFVFDLNQSTVAYYSIVKLANPFELLGVELSSGFWLEHMFVLPKYIGRKVGSEMMSHVKKICNERKICELRVLADPNSKLFYEKMGFKYLRDVPSTIQNRQQFPF